MPHPWRRRSALIAVSVGVFMAVLAGSSQAVVRVGHTNLTIRVVPGGQLSPGDPASVAGVLAGPPWCRDSQLITISDQDGVLGTTVTDARGHYQFDLIVESEMSVQASFAGLQQGQHPDRTICLPSESRWVRVRADKKAAASAQAAVRGRHAELLLLV